jgi:hypothetical protein
VAGTGEVFLVVLEIVVGGVLGVVFVGGGFKDEVCLFVDRGRGGTLEGGDVGNSEQGRELGAVDKTDVEGVVLVCWG